MLLLIIVVIYNFGNFWELFSHPDNMNTHLSCECAHFIRKHTNTHTSAHKLYNADAHTWYAC